MKFLTDTNFLIRVRDADDPRHTMCVQALQRLQAGENEVCVCAQVLIEYWVVATRPRDVNGLGLRSEDVEADLREIDEIFVTLPEPPDMAVRWRLLANEHAVQGRQAHDTRLVALMLAHGITHLLKKALRVKRTNGQNLLHVNRATARKINPRSLANLPYVKHLCDENDQNLRMQNAKQMLVVLAAVTKKIL